VSRYIYCYSLAKSWRVPIFCRCQIFVTFSARRAGTISRYSGGESSPIKAGCPAATAHLAIACGGINTTGRRRRTSARSGRSQLLWTLLGKNTKEMLPPMRQPFVNGRILSTRVFCRREYFVDSNILST
jgi:hypothetical protein